MTTHLTNNLRGLKIIHQLPMILFALITTILLSGCATSSVFTSYPEQLAAIKHDITLKQFKSAQNKLSRQIKSSDKLLYLMERGRVSYLAGEIVASIDDFKQAIQIFEANERKASVTASGAASQIGALLVNDNVIPYTGSAYERIFVHHYQALNYLKVDDIESAGVEIRRANLEQQLALKKYEDELENLYNSKKTKQILNSNANYKQKNKALLRLSGNVKNSFQNAYTFYISALIYEALGNPNDAYIDYKKALEIFPDNKYILSDVIRLAQQLAMEDNLELYNKNSNSYLSQPTPHDKGRLVILYENSFVPKKVEIYFPLWVIGFMHSIAFPSYNYHPINSNHLNLIINNIKIGSSEQIVDVSALAAKALEEQIPMIMIRQALRVISREQATRDMKNSTLGLIGSLSNLLLNRADLRSWLTLPASAEIMFTNITRGQHAITLQHGNISQSLDVKIAAGQTLILHVAALNNQLLINKIKL